MKGYFKTLNGSASAEVFSATPGHWESLVSPPYFEAVDETLHDINDSTNLGLPSNTLLT